MEYLCPYSDTERAPGRQVGRLGGYTGGHPPQLSKHFRVEKTYTDFRQMLAKESLGRRRSGGLACVALRSRPRMSGARPTHIAGKTHGAGSQTRTRPVRTSPQANREIVMGYPWQFLQLSLRARGVFRSGSLGRWHFISNVLSSSALDIFRGDDRLDQPEMASHYPLIGPGYLYSDPARSVGGQGHLQVTHSATLMFFLTGLKPSSVLALLDNLDV